MFSIDDIKKRIQKHPRLNLFVFIFRNIVHDKKKCVEIVESQKNPYIVSYNHFGELNKGKIFYVVSLSEFWKKSGYCHLLRMTLLKLAYADRFGFVPVVRWAQDILYASEDMQGIIDNPYEYFFDNTTLISDDELNASDLVVISKDTDVRLYESAKTYLVSDDELHILSKMVKKYLTLNETGKKSIEEVIVDRFQEYSILGVHVRKTDYKKNFNDHPVPIDDNYILQKVDALLKSGKYDKVFLATDSIEVLDKYKSVFCEKLLYNDVLRSDNGKALHYEYVTERDNNNYLLGQEILLDVYSLAACSGLIAGLSNVSVIARAIKYSRDEKYIDEVILNNGINENLNIFNLKKDNS